MDERATQIIGFILGILAIIVIFGVVMKFGGFFNKMADETGTQTEAVQEAFGGAIKQGTGFFGGDSPKADE